MTLGSATLIGIDWGTSSLRAYLFGENGNVLDTLTRPWGVLATPGGNFSAAYDEVVRAWRSANPNVPAVAAGMIGSTEGWIRAPYCPCPAGARELAAGMVEIQTSAAGRLHVIPGVEMRGAAPNVMRGEETQVAGALALRPDLAANATLVLPGTHAKWVAVRDGQIVSFTTYMTGELFAVLRDHSILGRPAQSAVSRPAQSAVADAAIPSPQWEAFDRGVRSATAPGGSGIAGLLFLTRSLVLQNALRPEESLDFLSGLLIGDELRSGLATAGPQLALVGDPALCERYRRALAYLGRPATPVIDHTAPAGLWQIARHAKIDRPVAHA